MNLEAAEHIIRCLLIIEMLLEQSFTVHVAFLTAVRLGRRC